MRKILIGSKAIKHWYEDFTREPKDTDFAVDEKESSNDPNIEYLYNPVLFKYTNDEILSSEFLLTLKASHLFYDTNWDKHMFDAQFLIKHGNQIKTDLFFDLVEFWEDYLPKIKRSKLDMSKEDFFTNKVNYDVAEHDILHTFINPVPLYQLILKDGCEVNLDESKWDELDDETKMELVQEEVYVMAYERYRKLDYRVAYSRMLNKFIMTHAPVFMVPFIVQNYLKMLKPKFNYYERIERHVSVGVDRSIEQEVQIS